VAGGDDGAVVEGGKLQYAGVVVTVTVTWDAQRASALPIRFVSPVSVDRRRERLTDTALLPSVDLRNGSCVGYHAYAIHQQIGLRSSHLLSSHSGTHLDR
jgi:hypothetical protein